MSLTQVLGVYVQAQVCLNVPAQRLHDFHQHGLAQGVAVVHEEWRRVSVQHRLAEPISEKQKHGRKIATI